MTVRPVGALGAAAAVVVAVVLGACGSPGPALSGPGRLPVTAPPTGPAAPPGSRQSVPTTAPPTTAAPLLPLGTAVNVTGPGPSLALVNATAIVDPASPAHSYDAAGPGQRFVAVRLQIADTGPIALQENALTDTTISVSTGAAVAPVVTEVAGCGSFVGGEFALGPHSAVVATCVTFELPTATAVTVVHFALGRDVAGQGSWAVP